MIKKYIIIGLIGITAFSCKTMSLQNEWYQVTTQNVPLGELTTTNKLILKQPYQSVSTPDYTSALKLQVIPQDFSKKTFKAFQASKEVQGSNISVNYTDSLQQKPKFLKLKIADKVSLIKMLQDTANKDILSFLKHNDDSRLITGVNMVFNQSTQDIILNADEVFLKPSGLKSYALYAYKNDLLAAKILFKEGIVFGLQSSSACWKQNDKYNIEIIDLITGNESCPDRSYRSAKHAKKKINYYKF